MVPNHRALASVPWTSCLRGEPAGALCDSHAPEDPVLIPRGTGQPTLGNVSRQGTGDRVSMRKAGCRHLFPLPTGTFPGPVLASRLPSLPRPSGPSFPWASPLLSLGRGLW